MKNIKQCIYLTDRNLSERYVVSRGTIWRWVSDGNLPKPVKLGPGCTRWRLRDIEEWEKKLEPNN